MPEDSLRSVANELMAWLPVQTVRTGLVDSLLYDDQLQYAAGKIRTGRRC